MTLRAKCKRDHPLSSDNVISRTRKDGRLERRCRICHRETNRLAAQRRRRRKAAARGAIPPASVVGSSFVERDLLARTLEAGGSLNLRVGSDGYIYVGRAFAGRVFRVALQRPNRKRQVLTPSVEVEVVPL